MSSTWLADTTANRYIKTYFNGFVDVSGGDIIQRSGNIDLSGGNIILNGSSGFKKNGFSLSVPILVANDSLATQSSLDLKANLDSPTFPSRVYFEESIKLIKKASSGSVNAILWGEENQFNLRGYINCDPIGNKKMNFNVLTSVLTDGFEFSGGNVNILNGVLKLNGSNIADTYQTISGMTNYANLDNPTFPSRVYFEESIKLIKKASSGSVNAILWGEENQFNLRGYINCDPIGNKKMNFNVLTSVLTDGFEFSGGNVNISSGNLKINNTNIADIYQSISSMSSYLTTETANILYQPISLMTDYLTAAVASSTYQTISNMSDYITTALATKHYTFAYNTATQSNLTVTFPTYSSLAMASTSMRVGMGIGGSLTVPVYAINRAGNYSLSVTLQCSISTSPSSVNIYYYKNNVLIPKAGALFFMGHYYGTSFVAITSTLSASTVQSFAAGDLIIVRILASNTGVSLSTTNGYSSSVFIQEL